jgi:chromosome partitioning protein
MLSYSAYSSMPTYLHISSDLTYLANQAYSPYLASQPIHLLQHIRHTLICCIVRRMVITIASFKGGVGKSTTAIHLAKFFDELAPTVLVDGDPNRSVTKWAKRGSNALTFRVIDERLLAKEARNFTHTVIDTKARPDEEDLHALVEGSDLLILPCTPDALALETLDCAVNELHKFGGSSYRVLLTNVPPAPQRDGEDARELLESLNLPLFKRHIRSVKAFKRAAILGCTVREVPGDERSIVAWDDYEAIGNEILTLLNQESNTGASLVEHHEHTA